MKIMNFEIVATPEDFALVTALYRSSVDGRRFLYEAILSEDGNYNIPNDFTSRTSEILQVYFKSLGVGMKTIIDDSEFIGEPEHANEEVGIQVGSSIIFCTRDEEYYLLKLQKVYRRYIKENPNQIDDVDEVWDYIIEHLPFKKKYLTDNIVKIFKDNLDVFSQSGAM